MNWFVLACMIAVAVTAPQQSKDVQILRYESDNIGVGGYRFAYEQSDGQKRGEQGSLQNEGREDESIAVKGSYSWIGPDGVTYIVTYIADDNGFQPEIVYGSGCDIPAHVAALLGYN